MTHVDLSMLRRPFHGSGLNPGDSVCLPVDIAERWVRSGWAVFACSGHRMARNRFHGLGRVIARSEQEAVRSDSREVSGQ